MRIQGKLRLGFFPLPLTEARRIRACLRYPASPFSAIDPCIGDGAAFLTITGESGARRYGIELDAYRAEQATAVVDEIIHGDCLDVHCLGLPPSCSNPLSRAGPIQGTTVDSSARRPRGAMRRQRHVERCLRFRQGPAYCNMAGGQGCRPLGRNGGRWDYHSAGA